MENNQTQTIDPREMFQTLLEFKAIAHSRGLLNAKDVQDYVREEKGAVGERIVSDFLRQEGAAEWINLRNVWLFDGSLFECDSILFTHHTLHTFEIKHYTGRFTYEDGNCQIGTLQMENDCIQQARKSFLKFRKLCQQFSSNIQVNGALIFSSNKNKVLIKAPPKDIHILEMPDLYEYIQNILQEERENPYPPIDWRPLIEHLQSLQQPNPFYPEAITNTQMKEARKGIQCGLCKNFDVTFSKHYVTCSCGYHESREEAIVRSACEYGVLMYDRDFSTGDILAFIDHQASSVFVQKTLAKYLVMVNKNKYTFYKNMQSNYPSIHSHFDYARPATYHSLKYPKNIHFLSSDQ